MINTTFVIFYITHKNTYTSKEVIGWRGKPVTVQNIYKLISNNMKNGTQIPFEYVEKGKRLYIKKQIKCLSQYLNILMLFQLLNNINVKIIC